MTFIIHAVLLHQTFVHCERFPTAASRRSMGRVSVPLWLFYLSVQLDVIGLVSHYLTNYLISRTLIQKRCKRNFNYFLMPSNNHIRYQLIFRLVIPNLSVDWIRVTHPFATNYKQFVRLACIRHTASVNPEPGSNSHLIDGLYLVFKEQSASFLINININLLKRYF